jgi:hypothetical protein
MPWVRRVVLVAAVGLPLLAAAPAGAAACGCAKPDARQIARGADAIVSGSVAQVITIDPTHSLAELVVDGVYRGKVGPAVTLTFDIGPGGGTGCAIFYPEGTRVDPAVLTRQGDGTYAVEACALAVLPEIRSIIGEPRAPPGGSVPVLTPPPASAVPSPVADVSGSVGVSWPAVAGGLAIGVGLIAYAVRRSMRERVGRDDQDEGPGPGATPPGEPTVSEPSG